MQELNLLRAQKEFTSFLVEIAELREKVRLMGLELIQARRDPAIKDQRIGDLQREVESCGKRLNKLSDHLRTMPKIGKTKAFIRWVKTFDVLINGYETHTLNL